MSYCRYGNITHTPYCLHKHSTQYSLNHRPTPHCSSNLQAAPNVVQSPSNKLQHVFSLTSFFEGYLDLGSTPLTHFLNTQSEILPRSPVCGCLMMKRCFFHLRLMATAVLMVNIQELRNLSVTCNSPNLHNNLVAKLLGELCASTHNEIFLVSQLGNKQTTEIVDNLTALLQRTNKRNLLVQCFLLTARYILKCCSNMMHTSIFYLIAVLDDLYCSNNNI